MAIVGTLSGDAASRYAYSNPYVRQLHPVDSIAAGPDDISSTPAGPTDSSSVIPKPHFAGPGITSPGPNSDGTIPTVDQPGSGTGISGTGPITESGVIQTVQTDSGSGTPQPTVTSGGTTQSGGTSGSGVGGTNATDTGTLLGALGALFPPLDNGQPVYASAINPGGSTAPAIGLSEYVHFAVGLAVIAGIAYAGYRLYERHKRST